MYKWRTIIFRYTILDCYYEFARLLDILIALSEATVYIDEFIVGPITHHALRVGFGVCMPLACKTRTQTDTHALLLGIADSTCQTGDMGPSRSTPRSACASTHPRSRRSSPPPPSPLHPDSKQAAGRRHGGATPPR